MFTIRIQRLDSPDMRYYFVNKRGPLKTFRIWFHIFRMIRKCYIGKYTITFDDIDRDTARVFNSEGTPILAITVEKSGGSAKPQIKGQLYAGAAT